MPKQKSNREYICKHRLIVMWDYWRVGCSLARSDDLGAYVIGTHFSSIWLRLFGVVTVCRFACTIFYGKLSMVQSLVAMALNAMKRMNNARLWRCSHLWNKQFCLFHSSLSLNAQPKRHKSNVKRKLALFFPISLTRFSVGELAKPQCHIIDSFRITNIWPQALTLFFPSF